MNPSYSSLGRYECTREIFEQHVDGSGIPLGYAFEKICRDESGNGKSWITIQIKLANPYNQELSSVTLPEGFVFQNGAWWNSYGVPKRNDMFICEDGRVDTAGNDFPGRKFLLVKKMSKRRLFIELEENERGNFNLPGYFNVVPASVRSVMEKDPKAASYVKKLEVREVAE